MAAALGRVRGAATFQELRRSGHRVRSGPLSVTWLPSPSDGPPRLAFAIGRSVGTAVVRNRIRRRLRALFTELAFELPPGTYLVSTGAAAATLDHDDLRQAIRSAAAGLAGRS